MILNFQLQLQDTRPVFPTPQASAVRIPYVNMLYSQSPGMTLIDLYMRHWACRREIKKFIKIFPVIAKFGSSKMKYLSMSLYLYTLIICQIPFAAFVFSTLLLFLRICLFSLSACTEAYSQPDEQYACHLGCQDQLPFAELRQEQVRDNTTFPNCLLVCFDFCYVT